MPTETPTVSRTHLRYLDYIGRGYEELTRILDAFFIPALDLTYYQSDAGMFVASGSQVASELWVPAPGVAMSGTVARIAVDFLDALTDEQKDVMDRPVTVNGTQAGFQVKSREYAPGVYVLRITPAWV